MKITPWIISIVLMSLLFLQLECQRKTEHVKQENQVIIIKGDSIPVPYPVVSAPRDSLIFVYDTVSTGIDSAKVFADYYTKVYGSIIMANDSNIYVSMDYLVTQNRLVWVKPKIQNKRNTVIIQNTAVINQEKTRNKFYAGLGIGRSPVSFGLSANLLMVNKKQNAYSLAYDAINNDFYFTFYWQIRFK
jgi:hypothetical protein